MFYASSSFVFSWCWAEGYRLRVWAVEKHLALVSCQDDAFPYGLTR